MSLIRFTSPTVVSAVTAEVESFTYLPGPRHVRVHYVFKAPDGTVVRRETTDITTIPGTVLTTLGTLITRIYTYLQSTSLIPAGVEEP